MANYVHSGSAITKQDIAALKSGDRYYVRVDRRWGADPIRATFEIVQQIDHHGKSSELHYDIACDARFEDYGNGDTSYVVPPEGYDFEYTAFDSVYPADSVRTLAHFLKPGDRLTLYFIRANGSQHWAARGVSMDQLAVEVFRENAPKDKFGCTQKFVFGMHTSLRDNMNSTTSEMVRRRMVPRTNSTTVENAARFESSAS